MSLPPPLLRFHKLAYGLGQAAEGLKNGAFNVFLFFYYVQVLELSTSLAGLALLISLFFDALTGPLVGSISDSWKGQFGRRHPFLFMSILPLGVSLVLLFNPPALGQVGLFSWLTVFAVLARVSIACFDIPHLSLGAELTQHFHERTEVVAYRFFFGYSGQILAYFIGFQIFLGESPAFPEGGQFNIGAYLPFSITLASLIAIVIASSAFGTLSRIPYLHTTNKIVPNNPKELLFRGYRDIKNALSNSSFRWLFGGALIVYMMVGVDQALNLHMNTYFWELRSTGNLLFFMAIPVGAVTGTFFARSINVAFDKRPAIIVGTLWWASCQIIPVILRLLDWLPENGTSELLWTLIAIKFIQGFGTVQALITYHSMIADIADEHELAMGERQEGVFFAAVSFSNKVTTGMGTAVAGLALSLIAWPSGSAIRSAADVPADKIVWLGLLYGPIVAGFALLGVYCYTKYDLDEKRHAEIMRKIVERKFASNR